MCVSTNSCYLQCCASLEYSGVTRYAVSHVRLENSDVRLINAMRCDFLLQFISCSIFLLVVLCVTLGKERRSPLVRQLLQVSLKIIQLEMYSIYSDMSSGFQQANEDAVVYI